MSRDENFERQLYHACGNLRIGKERNKAEELRFHLDPDGESGVVLGKIPKDIDAWYEIGVAGLLAEAKGQLPHLMGFPQIDLTQMESVAHEINDELAV